MSFDVADEPRRWGPTNPRVEMARYTISGGERVIYGQRVLGVVRLTDVPADGHGRHYVIERELNTMSELEAIIADYLDQADRWDAAPAEPCCYGSAQSSAESLWTAGI